MHKFTQEQINILQTYWKRLFLLYGTNPFRFWHQPEHLRDFYWGSNGIVHSEDIIDMGFATCTNHLDMSNFQFTQKFIDEVVNE